MGDLKKSLLLSYPRLEAPVDILAYFYSFNPKTEPAAQRKSDYEKMPKRKVLSFQEDFHAYLQRISMENYCKGTLLLRFWHDFIFPYPNLLYVKSNQLLRLQSREFLSLHFGYCLFSTCVQRYALCIPIYMWSLFMYFLK